MWKLLGGKNHKDILNLYHPNTMAKKEFDENFILQYCNSNKFRFADKSLTDIFEQKFLKQQTLVKIKSKFIGTDKNWKETQENINTMNILTPIFTVAGLMKRKRNMITHRKGTHLISTSTLEVNNEVKKKTKILNFIREGYAGENQAMIFGHFNTPIETIFTCGSLLKKAEEFVNETKEKFPTENIER